MPNRERVETQTVDLGNSLMGYLARPSREGARPSILLVHGAYGLVSYVKETVERVAESGYVALAVDMFEGRTYAPDEERPRGGGFTQEELLDKIGRSLRFLDSHQASTRHHGVIGFCMGGGLALSSACRFANQVDVCAVFYGSLQSEDPLANLRGPVVASFGEDDQRVTSWARERFEPAMERLGKRLDMKVYPGAPHGFFDHTTPAVYRREAAEDAFSRSMAMFGETLG